VVEALLVDRVEAVVVGFGLVEGVRHQRHGGSREGWGWSISPGEGAVALSVTLPYRAMHECTMLRTVRV
jgi:hypothetical protein